MPFRSAPVSRSRTSRSASLSSLLRPRSATRVSSSSALVLAESIAARPCCSKSCQSVIVPLPAHRRCRPKRRHGGDRSARSTRRGCSRRAMPEAGQACLADAASIPRALAASASEAAGRRAAARPAQAGAPSHSRALAGRVLRGFERECPLSVYDPIARPLRPLVAQRRRGRRPSTSRRRWRSGGPVLELGVGTGRIAVPTAAAGVERDRRRLLARRCSRSRASARAARGSSSTCASATSATRRSAARCRSSRSPSARCCTCAATPSAARCCAPCTAARRRRPLRLRRLRSRARRRRRDARPLARARARHLRARRLGRGAPGADTQRRGPRVTERRSSSPGSRCPEWRALLGERGLRRRGALRLVRRHRPGTATRTRSGSAAPPTERGRRSLRAVRPRPPRSRGRGARPRSRRRSRRSGPRATRGRRGCRAGCQA